MDNEALQEAKDELTIAGYFVGVGGNDAYYEANVETPDEWECHGKKRHVKLGEEDKLYAELQKEATIKAYAHLEKERQFAAQAQRIARLEADNAALKAKNAVMLETIQKDDDMNFVATIGWSKAKLKMKLNEIFDIIQKNKERRPLYTDDDSLRMIAGVLKRQDKELGE